MEQIIYLYCGMYHRVEDSQATKRITWVMLSPIDSAYVLKTLFTEFLEVWFYWNSQNKSNILNFQLDKYAVAYK